MSVRDKVRRSDVGQISSDESARTRMRKKKSSKKNKEIFLRTKMWLSYLLSLLEKDMGKIPDNIGNKILITNNLYVTKLFMSSMIQVTAISLNTPITLTQALVEELRSKKSKAVIDVTMKNLKFDVKLKDSGLTSRIGLWEKAMNNDMISDGDKEVAARCLYTVEVAKDGNQLRKSRVFITVRAKTGSELTIAEKIIYDYLSSIGAEYLPITGNMKGMLRYVSLISDYRDKSIKDVKAIVNSDQTLAQMLPNSNSTNDKDGLYVGINILNNSKFRINFDIITVARNIYIIAPAGEGKTVLGENLASSALENKWALCAQDIKGNEFNTIVEGVGGYIVSLRDKATEYINTYRMYKADVDDGGADTYFKARIAFSKKQMMILTGIIDQGKLNTVEVMLDEFLTNLYTGLGVLPSNRNTWKYTDDLNPFTVYEYLTDFLKPEIQVKYIDVARTVISSLRMYMSKSGSKSYVFKQEFEYSAILRSPAIMFDFGMLEGSHNDPDVPLFKLRFAFMQKLNAEYITYKHSRGIKVMKILEESQIVDDEILRGYVEEFTLRRAQGQTTILIGNSIQALVNNAISKPIIENTKALFVGKLPKEARSEVVSQFGLQDQAELLDRIGKNEEYTNAFLFVNRMQPRSLTPVIKLILDKEKGYKIFKPVAQNNSLAK